MPRLNDCAPPPRAAVEIIADAQAERGIDWKADVTRVLRKHQVTIDQLRVPCRRWVYARMRWELMFVLWLRGWSLPRIGHYMRRDHTTVMYGIARHLGMAPDHFRQSGCASSAGYALAKQMADRPYGRGLGATG